MTSCFNTRKIDPSVQTSVSPKLMRIYIRLWDNVLFSFASSTSAVRHTFSPDLPLDSQKIDFNIELSRERMKNRHFLTFSLINTSNEILNYEIFTLANLFDVIRTTFHTYKTFSSSIHNMLKNQRQCMHLWRCDKSLSEHTHMRLCTNIQNHLKITFNHYLHAWCKNVYHGLQVSITSFKAEKI